jgi:hypothetical protein
MKKIFVYSITLFIANNLLAQQIPMPSIKDSLLGWMKVYHFKGSKQSTRVDDKLYSANQLSLCDSFANWIQASYIPKGGLGDVKKAVSDKLGLYNQYTAGKPQSFGAYSKTYTELKYNSAGKMEPYTNTHTWWGIYANGVPGDWPVRDICTPSQYYFTIPTAATQEYDEEIKKQLDISAYPCIKTYISFWVKNMGFGGGKEVVILCKDNKLPFIKISMAEYLQLLENAIPVFYEAEKKRISEAEQGVQQRMAVSVKHLDEKIAGYKNCINKNREKYSGRMNEPAMTRPSPGLSDLGNGKDLFNGQDLTDPEPNAPLYPIYKIDPGMAARCKEDKPQWVIISWSYYVHDVTEQQQHDAILNHFNFEYVYNFFFNPEKVKGQMYKPVRIP